LVLSPNCPKSFEPQQYAVLSVVMPQVWSSPATIERSLRAMTEMLMVSLTPSLVAITLTTPPTSPRTNPFESTLAFALLSTVQVIARPINTRPRASRVVAERGTE